MKLDYNNPIYLEIINEYKKYIDLGIYKYNDRLPSVRSLAAELGINPNTVQRAYRILEEDGYVKTLSTKGVCVCKIKDENNTDKLTIINDIKNYIKTYVNQNITKEDFIEIIEEVYND